MVFTVLLHVPRSRWWASTKAHIFTPLCSIWGAGLNSCPAWGFTQTSVSMASDSQLLPIPTALFQGIFLHTVWIKECWQHFLHLPVPSAHKLYFQRAMPRFWAIVVYAASVSVTWVPSCFFHALWPSSADIAASQGTVHGLYSEADAGSWACCRMELRAEGWALFAHWLGKRSG